MREKNLKPNDNSKDLLDNFDLWEELEDQAGEKISGGAIFSFVNRTTRPIDVTLLDGTTTGTIILEETIISPSNLLGTQSVNVPGFNQVFVQFDSTPGTITVGEEPAEAIMTSNRRGIFSLVPGTGTIEFTLG